MQVPEGDGNVQAFQKYKRGPEVLVKDWWSFVFRDDLKTGLPQTVPPDPSAFSILDKAVADSLMIRSEHLQGLLYPGPRAALRGPSGLVK